ncbi:aminopeptidase P family protein [Cucumibacter marinus]|uniref:aminopeptidase P family protein n=1 Tax=Cucumibacter marinus TaxID=1121252 RepID=UPI00041B9619|nr:aminopeptidase P family protein [Cucumibacter marinus]
MPFQSFEERADTAAVSGRVNELRARFDAAGIDAFMIPRADAHRGETVPKGEERLAWISAFTGSAGLAIVARNAAALFVDGRYTLQAPKQTDTSVFTIIERPPADIRDWLAENLAEGNTIGFDPWLHTAGEIEALETALGPAGLNLSPVDNQVDAIWQNRPAAPADPVIVLEDERAGVSSADKRAAIVKKLKSAKADALFLSLPESINWLFNIRGTDIPNTPVTLGFAIVTADGGAELFLNPGKITPEITTALGGVKLRPDTELRAALESLGQAGKTVWIDPATCPAAAANLITDAGGKLVRQADPVALPKAIKNPTEIEGMRQAQALDAVAMSRFLTWFDNEAPKGELTEIDIVSHLEGYRRQANSLVDISFETISGAGPNGAITHYRVTENSNRTLNPGELMLVDSGGQYREGTTDITRTMATGPVPTEVQKHFTLVLKGMIALSRASFPKGTTGQQLEVFARQFLWAEGLNYNHGTGHGVGAFLGVHEGPCNIGPRPSAPLEPGMILSNEPGFYLENQYGIRIENLILVVESPHSTPEKPFYSFETLTYVPIDLRLIDPTLMTADEKAWLNAYHQKAFDETSPKVEAPVADWLREATRPI